MTPLEMQTPYPPMDGLIATLLGAAEAAESFVRAATTMVRARVSRSGKLDRTALDREQHRVHGLAWYATYAQVFRQIYTWAARLEALGAFGETEQLLARLITSEYASQLVGGIPMNQGEVIRPADLGVSREEIDLLFCPPLARLMVHAGGQAVKSRVADKVLEATGRSTVEATGLDETYEVIRDQFHAFSEKKIRPFAHQWHLQDRLIPLELVNELAELGVFGLTLPEAYGGAGLGKTAMCVVSEVLSRGYIGVGSLPTRSEIAGDLILSNGTTEQIHEILPKIASGAILPTAVFTEPDTGSDLGSLKTRAARHGSVYKVHGAKTWITHAARADLMTLLVRTDPAVAGYGGLSMLLAQKPRGTEADPFPAEGMTGSEIAVIGYRGMKEFEIGFDGFEVPAENLLGGVEGHGFKQLMTTFESARIQTAARGVGVAQAAMDEGLKYANERIQFGRPIFNFPRVHNKLAMMAAEITAVRQLTYFAAAEKDQGRRCDLEAGMAKLLAARVAWSAADNALQIHGGNGFAMEYPVSRLLADARILNIFEGSGEIQAQVIGRRLLEEGRN